MMLGVLIVAWRRVLITTAWSAGVIAAAPAWIGLAQLSAYHEWESLVMPVITLGYAVVASRYLGRDLPARLRRFARVSFTIMMVLTVLAQPTYYLLAASHVRQAPVIVIVVVAVLPPAVMAAAVALAVLAADVRRPGDRRTA